MTDRPIVSFASLGSEMAGTLVLLVGEGPTLPPAAEKIDRQMQGALKRAAEAADFKGKARSTIEILGANSAPSARIILLGIGKAGDQKHLDWHRLGGVAYAQIAARNPAAASILVDGTGPEAAEHAAMVAAGAQLRAYNFRKYITRESSDSNGQAPKQLPRLTVHTADPGAATEAFFHHEAVAKGVYLARDLVNEPANILGPVEFADRLNALESSGVEVEILAENRLKELKMGALLAVGQGSVRESRVVVMQWHGAKRARNKAPVCIVGKGVCFDTGGISMKPAAGMEDMKGDMGGAGCVAGLMLALAERRAPVNVIGLVGLVENMPSGSATRPGDIVTSMSGQTIEVLNTDAEGRLVLADVLWYAQERFKPRMIVDLATLTGAIMVALGKEHAGLFSNNDKLVRELVAAGEVTGEKVWHMPLGPGYDKLIDSKNADMKNIGGRFGGAITAAQFIQRFIKDKATPWAHLDIAATAFDSSKNDINQSWGSGWGVRLLDQLIAENYEKS